MNNFKHFMAIARPLLQGEATEFHQLMITFFGLLCCINTLDKVVHIEDSVLCSGCHRKLLFYITTALLEAIIGTRWRTQLFAPITCLLYSNIPTLSSVLWRQRKRKTLHSSFGTGTYINIDSISAVIAI